MADPDTQCEGEAPDWLVEMDSSGVYAGVRPGVLLGSRQYPARATPHDG